MKMMYALFDKKAKAYLTPFFSENSATAMRTLVGPANSRESFLGVYPDDYDVYILGDFDEQSGKVNGINPEYVFRIADLVRQEKTPPILQNTQEFINAEEK